MKFLQAVLYAQTLATVALAAPNGPAIPRRDESKEPNGYPGNIQVDNFEASCADSNDICSVNFDITLQRSGETFSCENPRIPRNKKTGIVVDDYNMTCSGSEYLNWQFVDQTENYYFGLTWYRWDVPNTLEHVGRHLIPAGKWPAMGDYSGKGGFEIVMV